MIAFTPELVPSLIVGTSFIKPKTAAASGMTTSAKSLVFHKPVPEHNRLLGKETTTPVPDESSPPSEDSDPATAQRQAPLNRVKRSTTRPAINSPAQHNAPMLSPRFRRNRKTNTIACQHCQTADQNDDPAGPHSGRSRSKPAASKTVSHEGQRRFMILITHFSSGELPPAIDGFTVTPTFYRFFFVKCQRCSTGPSTRQRHTVTRPSQDTIAIRWFSVDNTDSAAKLNTIALNDIEHLFRKVTP